MKKEWIKYIAVGLILIAVGAIFYPSKTITIEEKYRLEQEITKLKQEKKDIKTELETKLTTEEQKNIIYKRETESKLSSLRTENTSLKQRVSERTLKIIKPDGTIVEETFKESQTEMVTQVITEIKQEFNEKVQSIENKWKKIHERRVLKIKEDYSLIIKEKDTKLEEYSKKKTVEINKRKFGISFGYLGQDNYFSSVQYDVFGPMFLDLHMDEDSRSGTRTGIGMGIRF